MIIDQAMGSSSTSSTDTRAKWMKVDSKCFCPTIEYTSKKNDHASFVGVSSERVRWTLSMSRLMFAAPIDSTEGYLSNQSK